MWRASTAVVSIALVGLASAAAVATTSTPNSSASPLAAARPVGFRTWNSTPVKTGTVGSYRFSLAARTGQSVTCSFDGRTLVRITERPPLAKMRTYWTRPHGGRIADGQNVGFVATLFGEHKGHWSKLSTHQRFTLVGTSWKRLSRPAAFTPSAGL